MTHFTEEQLKELETMYGLKRKKETLPVRDGVVTKDTMVWWRARTGPELVRADQSDHWASIGNFPNVYQLVKPRTKVTYVD